MDKIKSNRENYMKKQEIPFSSGSRWKNNSENKCDDRRQN